MSDADLGLIERAAARGLIPADALERARRECRAPAAEWLLDQKLLTQEQLSRLLEDELPMLPRAVSKDSSWAVFVFIFVIIGATFFGFLFYALGPRSRPPPPIAAVPVPISANPELDAGKAMVAHNYPLAVTYYSQAIARSPRNAFLYSFRSGAYERMKDLAAALADAEYAVTLEPANVSFHICLAGVLIDLGRAQDAVDDLEKLLPSPDRDSMLKSAKTIAELDKK